MTSDRFNLSEFSEYLDDTEGHRLAQFLQKKSGAVRNGAKRIFDCEPKRFSLNVRLKRLSSPPVPADVDEVEHECVIPETQDEDNENDVQNKEQRAELSVRNVLQQNLSQENHAQSSVALENTNNTHQNGTAINTSLPVKVMVPTGTNKTIREKQSMIISPVKSHETNKTLGPEVGVPSKISETVQRTIITEQNEPNDQPIESPLPMCTVSNSPVRLNEPNLRESQAECPRSPTFRKPELPLPIIPRTPRSPILKVSRSGGRSGDRLRRQVLKRLSNMENNGRRTLLKEFESTLYSSDFSPPICSTPMHHTPAEDVLKTPPRVNNSQNILKTTERNENIPNNEASQHTQNASVNQQEQSLLQNMVEALEETIKKIKSLENTQPTRTGTPESSINTTELPQTQHSLQQALVQTSNGNAGNSSKVLDTENLLQEVQKALTELRNSNMQSPKIVIPVNQTFNNVPAAVEKQIGANETNTECESAKVAQEAKTKTGGISHNNIHGTNTNSHCTRQHTLTESNLNNTSNCASPNNFINHPTFTRNDTAKTNLPTDSIQYNNATSRGSLRTWCQQTFTKQNGTHTDKVHGSLAHEPQKQEPSIRKCNNQTFAKSPTAPTRELRMSGNRTVSADISNPNISGVHSTLGRAENMRPATRSVHTTLSNKTLEVDLVKKQSIVNQNNSVAHASRSTRATNRQEVPTETADKEKSVKHALTEKSISLLLTDDEDEVEDTHYTVNKRHILRKSGPLNLAAEKPQTTKRSRRTIKRPTRTRTRALATSLLTSDTETESGPPPAHPLNLQHVKPVEHKKIHQLRRLPLNKAPSTPKNGELFADELKAQLARLTNHEILDLRKRNSLSLMNGKRLRKSTAELKQALQDKLKIEEEIEMEILRRELLGNTDGLQRKQHTEVAENPMESNGSESQLLNDVVEEVNDILFDKPPQAPAAFKDSSACATKTTEYNIDVSVPAPFKDNTAVVTDALKDNTVAALVSIEDNTEVVAAASEAYIDAVVPVTTTDDNADTAVIPAAPEPFQDNTDIVTAPNEFNTHGNIMHETLLQLTRRSDYNSSLVDDRSSERVTFVSSKLNNKSTTNEKRSRGRKKKSEQLPEVSKKYFELQKSIKKRRKNSISKRSLYSKGDSFDEDSEHSDNGKDNISRLIEPIPPPPTVSPVSEIQIASPPPQLTVSTASTYMLPRLPAEELVLPPAHFSDSNNPFATQVACQTDEELFKKPTKRAPHPSRKRKTPDTSILAPCNENEKEEGIRRSKRGQVPRNPSYLTTKRNGHSLFESLLSNVMKPKPSTKAQRKKTNETSSSHNSRFNCVDSRSDDLTTPVASSTVNVTNVKKRGRKPKQTQMAQTHAFSYLGETNVTSRSSVNSRAIIEDNMFSTPLQVIEEIPVETEEHATTSSFAAAAAANDNDNELPTTSNANATKTYKTTTKATKTTKTTTKSNRKTAATKKETAKAENKGGTRKRATGAKKKDQQQQQKEQHQEQETDAVEAAELAVDDDTPNHSRVLECSRVHLPPPPSLEKLSEMFDELKNAASKSRIEETASQGAESSSPTVGNDRVRRLRVRLRRVTAGDTDDASTGTSSASTSAANNESAQVTAGGRKELLAWLKNVSHLHSATDRQQVFMDMRPSTAGKLCFTDLEGIDYAFYDTEDKCSLGYLRFKPLQCKPSKRAKKYHLHFVVLAGTFEFSTERESGNFGVGDMIAINIGCRYSIKNMDNDIGILMVIKK
ncbi:uncharacterized protein LOC105219550 [Zeugodacus cucurbitae]|uniref:uncharacterized protein LOC105219550 n=1 Tax=Zeugodacus cucurbitae TaxID=28588 RepID=UPI0023D910DE|nr:uncharacterized protein LOC105219550 [Zeugodacus cucurbitae]